MAILMVVHKRVYEIGCDTSVGRRVDGLYAIGSGSPYAFGAMSHGAKLGDALKIAADTDPYTGGRLTVTSAKEMLAQAHV
jgi:ATP-dependent protease HslVU (ClpYQ) peptidase subunit